MKLGDWVIHDYKIKQITRVEGDTIKEVSDGSFSCSSSDLGPYCRPLTLKNKRYAESFKYYYDEIQKLDGSNAFNFPDINRYFCQLCIDAIDDKKMDYCEGELNQYIKKAKEFYEQIRDVTSSVPKIDGIRLFR